jgi:hypothetical protein
MSSAHRARMAPFDPSFLFAVGVALDLIYENLERKLPEEKVAGFWVEWMGWTILSAVSWARSTLYRRTTTSTIDMGPEEVAASGKPSQYRCNLWVAYALSPCLVGVGFLWQLEHENYNWILVGPHGTLVNELGSSCVGAATRHYSRASLHSSQTNAASEPKRPLVLATCSFRQLRMGTTNDNSCFFDHLVDIYLAPSLVRPARASMDHCW